MVTHNPLHGSGRAALPHPALAWGDDAQAHERLRVADAGRRKHILSNSPSLSQVILLQHQLLVWCGMVLIASPIGYRKGELRFEKDPDRRLQEAVRLVFQKLGELGSVRQTCCGSSSTAKSLWSDPILSAVKQHGPDQTADRGHAHPVGRRSFVPGPFDEVRRDRRRHSAKDRRREAVGE
jgi:hypothetical protein